MAHLFCQSCGTKISYAHAQPNFCSKCGTQLGNSVSTNTAAGLPTIEKSVLVSSDETDSNSVPVVANFQYEVEDSRNTITLGSLMGEPPSRKNEEGRKSRSVDEFIDEKKKEG